MLNDNKYYGKTYVAVRHVSGDIVIYRSEIIARKWLIKVLNGVGNMKKIESCPTDNFNKFIICL